ncbi:WD40 repeat domain-containing serine/threonine protein kinase [Spongiactinospora rosea]|uniref:WD40 repeat domain-containing serine/threonine protein kinase n=1 Tax=Spongiactinospora rosea TaxID=2248750 RepID=UPI0013148B0E|nr:WD40 repeat domain-containing serine/threonine protein kinase [Spongiactinospora rosea]
MLIEGDPQRLGRYWLAGRLGAGGQGVVYEAYTEDGRRVAIKVLHGDQVAQLGREAAAAQRVASFCTAPIIEAELEGPRPYIVSEYVEGPSLRTAGRIFAGDDLHRLATAIATALTAIHDAGVIHRDLKPDNVLLGPDGPRVIDFGIARTAEMSLTATGVVSGTPTYMAPEVFIGQRADASADVFAWGAVVVFAATGRDPFHAESLGSVMHQVLSATPDLSALPRTLRRLVSSALAKEPAQRPTARELLLALVSGDGDLDTSRLLAQGGHRAAGIGARGHDPALGTLAEQAYTMLDPAERELAPEVFLRLVTVDEEGELSVRHAELAELVEGRAPHEVAAVRRILAAFGYLLARQDSGVRLARPALPQAWPRYRRWIETNRDGLAVHRQILAAARRWEAAGRRDGDLFQGSSLENALQWAATARRDITLSPIERDFLSAAAVLARRRARRTRLASLSLGGLLVIALVAGGLAVQQSAVADDRAEQIARQLTRSEAARLAAVAATTRGSDPHQAMLASVAAWRLDGTPATRAALVASLAQRETAMFRDPSAAGDTVRTLGADGRTLISADSTATRVWDVRNGRLLRTLGARSAEPMDSVTLSPSGRVLVIVTARRAAAVDLLSGRLISDHAFPTAKDFLDERVDVAFEREGSVLLEEADRRTRWDLRTGAAQELGPAPAGTFSRDGVWRAARRGRHLELTDLRTGAKDFIGDTDGAGTQGTWNGGAAVFGAGLVATVTSRSVQFWRRADTQLLTTVQIRGDGEAVQGAFDGSTFRYLLGDQVFSVNVADLTTTDDDHFAGTAALSGDGRLVVRDGALWAVGGRKAGALPEAEHAVFSPDSRFVATYGPGVRIVDTASAAVQGTLRTSAVQAAFSPDGARLAVVTEKGGVELWDRRARRRVWSADAGAAKYAAFSSDGRTLVVAGDRLHLLETAGGKALGSAFGGGGRNAEGVRAYFTRSGKAVVVLDARRRMTVWDLATRRRLATARGFGAPAAYSPREDLLATFQVGGRVRLVEVMSGTDLGALPDQGGGQDPEVGQPLDVAFTGDGSAVLTVDGSGAVRRHAVGGEALAAAVCAKAGGLNAAQWREIVPTLPYRKACP